MLFIFSLQLGYFPLSFQTIDISSNLLWLPLVYFSFVVVFFNKINFVKKTGSFKNCSLGEVLSLFTLLSHLMSHLHDRSSEFSSYRLCVRFIQLFVLSFPLEHIPLPCFVWLCLFLYIKRSAMSPCLERPYGGCPVVPSAMTSAIRARCSKGALFGLCVPCCSWTMTTSSRWWLRLALHLAVSNYQLTPVGALVGGLTPSTAAWGL